ncbi:MAG: hypothetical protein ACXV5Q_03075 [Frankiaceae bacterium]
MPAHEQMDEPQRAVLAWTDLDAAARDTVLAAIDAVAPPPGGVLHVRRRTSAVGLVPAVSTLGPFADDAGRLHWVDLIPLFASRRIVRVGGAAPGAFFTGTITARSPTAFDLGAGSLWLAAAPFVGLAPAKAYFGLRIAGGAIELGAPGVLSGEDLVVPAGASGRIVVTPAPNPPDSSATVPDRAEFGFGGDVSLSAASVAVDGMVYGLTPTGGQAAFSPSNRRVRIPYTADQPALAGIASRVASFAAATITSAGWSLPVATIEAAGPAFDAGSGGALDLGLEGLTVSWAGLAGGSLPLGPATVTVNHDSTIVEAEVAGGEAARMRIAGWEGQRFTWDSTAGLIYHARIADVDRLEAPGTLSAQVDRLMLADGKPLEIRDAPASLARTDGPADVTTELTAEGPGRGVTALALTNALLTTTLPRSLSVTGTTGPDGDLAAGMFDVSFGLYQLLPILPDPYAANVDPSRRPDQVSGTVGIRIGWEPGAETTVRVMLPSDDAATGRVAIPSPIPGPADPRGDVWAVYQEHTGGPLQRPLRLLDICGAADQWGVVLGERHHLNQGAPSLEVDGMLVHAPGVNVQVFALPQVSWEPVTNIPNPNTLPFPNKVYAANDGNRTEIGVQTVRLVPVQPTLAARALLQAQRDEQAVAAARFTLPFGMDAVAVFDPDPGGWITLPSITDQHATFAAMQGAIQIRLAPGLRPRPGDGGLFGGPAGFEPVLPGGVALRRNWTMSDVGPIPGKSILDEPVGDFVDKTFTPPNGSRHEVPVSRLDLSGYGESCFSTWSDEHTPPSKPAVSQVRFDVINGRAGREVVMVRSILWPCQAIVVRTIVLERRSSGTVTRWDSGWVATTPGLFTSSDPVAKPPRFHTGLVRGMYSIRHIRDTPDTITLPKGGEVQRVTFDTDVEVEHVIGGADASGRVPSTGQTGFVQLMSVGANGFVVPGPLSTANLAALLDNHGPVGGPIDCVVDLGGSGQHARFGSLRAETARDPDFAVALYGMPVLNGSQQWSLARRTLQGGTSGEVHPVDAHAGAPVIRANGTTAYRFADPADLLDEANPAAEYGLLHAGQTHRALFPRLKVEPGQPAFVGEATPLVADPYAMLDAVGAFPKAPACLPTDTASWTLEAAPAGLTMPEPLVIKQIADRVLADTTAWSLRSQYRSAAMQLLIDPAVPVELGNPATWPIQMPAVATMLHVPAFDDLLSVVNHMPDLGPLKPSGREPEIVLGKALQELQDLIDVLKKLQLPIGLELSLAGSGLENQTYHLRFTGRLRLADAHGNRIEIGVGKLSGELVVGVDVAAHLGTGAGSGRMFFEVSGDIQQGIIPPVLYAGGLMKLHVSIDDKGDTDWQLDIGTVASIGGDLIPGLVELEATVHYAYLLKPDLIPAVRLGMDARAELLDGLVGVKFGVDASVAVSRLDDDHIRVDGDIVAMGEITAAWVFDEDFSRHFHFSQTLPMAVVQAALAAIVGPVPV